eukprot:jgi/Mesen1/5289/ME000263S04395
MYFRHRVSVMETPSFASRAPLDYRMFLEQPDFGHMEDLFTLGKEIGRGFYGTVRACSDKKSANIVACKSLDKAQLKWNPESVRREVTALRHLGRHPNIVEMIGCYEDSESVHLMLEYCKGGDLCDEINRRLKFSEEETALVFHQIATAVEYCHSKGIVHRDLKPENVLLSTYRADKSPAEYHVKLADFGQAVYLEEGEKMDGPCGSLYYLAPEQLQGKEYGFEADIWGLGVILCGLLIGQLPFADANKEALKQSACEGRIDFYSRTWLSVSNGAKNLVRKLLVVDPELRCSASEILSDPWLDYHVNQSKKRAQDAVSEDEAQVPRVKASALEESRHPSSHDGMLSGPVEVSFSSTASPHGHGNEKHVDDGHKIPDFSVWIDYKSHLGPEKSCSQLSGYSRPSSQYSFFPVSDEGAESMNNSGDFSYGSMEDEYMGELLERGEEPGFEQEELESFGRGGCYSRNFCPTLGNEGGGEVPQGPHISTLWDALFDANQSVTTKTTQATLVEESKPSGVDVYDVPPMTTSGSGEMEQEREQGQAQGTKRTTLIDAKSSQGFVGFQESDEYLQRVVLPPSSALLGDFSISLVHARRVAA